MAKSAILAAAALAAATFLCVRSAPADDVAPIKVVRVKINGNVREDPSPANPFAPGAMNFRQRLAMLRQLAADPDVAGVRLEVDGAPDFARSIDLMNELRRVKQAGKKIACYSENLDQRALVFASLGDVIMVPPSGMVALEGLNAEVMYMKDLLARLNVKVHVLHIGEFKTAFEEFARDGMSDEQRKTIEDLLGECYKQMIGMIAQNRNLDEKAVDGLFKKVFLDPVDAKEAGLITAVGYEDQFDAAQEKLFGGKFELDKEYGRAKGPDLEKMLSNPFGMFQLLPKLLNPEKPKLPDGPRIAVVYATGTITSGKSTAGFDGSVESMGSETLCEALETARNDDQVKAVVLRVNSPGGSALASDMIWRSIQRVREKKPVIASMGYVAASGGYWISMGCDRIVAQPSTLTGSIGVISMLPDVSGVLKNFGVKVEVVGVGPRAGELTMLKDGPSPLLQELIMDSMKHVYGNFLEKAAAGRKTTKEAIDAVAHGRVWTGRAALDINLVDRLGGFDDAIALACEMGGGLDPHTVPVAEYPEAPNFFDQFKEQMEDLTTIDGLAAVAARDLGYGDAVELARSLLHSRSALAPERVQAVLPFLMSIR